MRLTYGIVAALVVGAQGTPGTIDLSRDGVVWQVVETVPIGSAGVQFERVVINGESYKLRVTFPQRQCMSGSGTGR